MRLASPIPPSAVPFLSNHVGIVRGRLPATLVARTPFSDADTAAAPATTIVGAPVTFIAIHIEGLCDETGSIDPEQMRAARAGNNNASRSLDEPLRRVTVQRADIDGVSGARDRAQ